jgi:branched-chain amino acid transport system substrate-binding protein
VPVIIGALCTPVTHAIMPVLQDAKVPLIIATSAGQDFVDASGAGGDDYAFKTIASELDIARGLMRYLASKGVKSIAIITDAGGFPESNATAFAKVAQYNGIRVTSQDVVKPPAPTGAPAPATPPTDFAALIDKVKAGAPDQLVTMLFGPSAAAVFRAYEASGWKVPVTGRTDLGAAANAVSPAFRDAGGLAGMTAITVFTPVDPTPAVHDFVTSYQARYGLTPTQRSYFVYEAVYLAVDAIRRAGSDQPAAIEQALKTTTMPSLLGGTYALDDHNHPHLTMQIVGFKDGKPGVVATE